MLMYKEFKVSEQRVAASLGVDREESRVKSSTIVVHSHECQCANGIRSRPLSVAEWLRL